MATNLSFPDFDLDYDDLGGTLQWYAPQDTSQAGGSIFSRCDGCSFQKTWININIFLWYIIVLLKFFCLITSWVKGQLLLLTTVSLQNFRFVDGQVTHYVIYMVAVPEDQNFVSDCEVGSFQGLVGIT